MITKKLNNGEEIPVVGLGTWKSAPGKVKDAVKYAIEKVGYRHIDCAHIYKNEPEIGDAFSSIFQNNLNRGDVFITSKLWNNEHHPKDVEKACRRTLTNLRLDYLDLYLMHWGVAFKRGDEFHPKGENGKAEYQNVSIRETWEAMQGLVEKGLVKSIGVSNFTVMMLWDLLTYARIKPVINQVELHPYLQQEGLLNFCSDNDILTTAYSPLGSPGNSGQNSLLSDKTISKIATRHGKTTAQVLIRWSIERGGIVIPKSVTPNRIKENHDILNFQLDEEDIEEISRLDKGLRVVNPKDAWGIDYFG